MSIRNSESILFQEDQNGRWPWFWLVILPTLLVGLAPFAWGLYSQFVLGEPWGSRPMSDTALLITSAIAAVFFLAIGAFGWTCGLRTRVLKDGLYVQFFPIHFSPKRIPLENVVKMEVRTYRPLREYGGWGIRWVLQGKAYNMSGNRGVRLDYADGKHVLIGSQRPEELLAAIEQLHGKRDT